MDKRLQKRHKRQVARARQQMKQSEPDLRTPEQVKADREASRPANGWGAGTTGASAVSAPRGHATSGASSAAKTDV